MALTDRLTAALPLPPPVRRRLEPAKPKVAVVRLQGVISPTASPLARGAINLEALEPTLAKAFAVKGLAAVALAVNSPGGSPTQSALVADRIRGLAAEHDVPVLAFCEDVAASGGYWLACAADEIVAHPTSLVGSIGVVSAGFGLDGAIERYGVTRRLRTAGESKARLDPFLPEDPADVAWLRGELEELHRMFIDWVTERRGDRLLADADVFTGEVWTGAKAHGLGLVDALGTLRGVLAERFPDADVVPIDTKRSPLARLGIGAAAGLAPASVGDAVPALLEVLEQRAAWSRFGL